jgi:membrane-bound lytic murein transglycosylase A
VRPSGLVGGLVAAVLVAATLVLLPPHALHAEPARSSGQTTDLIDDLELRGLEIALTRSLSHLRALPADTRYKIAGDVVPVQRLIDSARHLHGLLQARPTPDALSRQLCRDYDLIRLSGQPDSPAPRLLVTGYYQPVFAGSLTPTPPFLHPLHRVPDNLVTSAGKGKKNAVSRADRGRLVPYWTRGEIEQGQLLQGAELVWLRDPFDAFVLHVQGSGVIQFPDGSVRGVHYAQSNGRAYRSVGKYLVEAGRMQLADVTMDSIRRYIEQHPAERDQILRSNDSYIFFHWSEPGPAVGSLGRELTAGRSVAADQRWYPPGAVLFLDSRRPVTANGEVLEWREMHRLVTVQDTGSALVGPGRLDVFWGTGDQAGQEAGQMKEDGAACLLLLKEGVSPKMRPLP